MPFVVNRAALVGHGVAGRRGEPSGLREQFLPGLPAAEQLGDACDGVVESEGGQSDGGVGDGAVRGERHGRAGGADRPVAHPAFNLL